MNKLYCSVAELMLDNMECITERSYYVSDLAFYMFESESVNGSITCSTYKAKQWIQEHFFEISEIYEDVEEVTDANPFKNPESFMVSVVLYVADDIIKKCPLFKNKERIYIDEDVISDFENYIKEIQDE